MMIQHDGLLNRVDWFIGELKDASIDFEQTVSQMTKSFMEKLVCFEVPLDKLNEKYGKEI